MHLHSDAIFVFVDGHSVCKRDFFGALGPRIHVLCNIRRVYDFGLLY